MRLAVTYSVVAVLLCTPLSGAERKSWNKIRYLGGTIEIKTSPYDWNTTLTMHPDAIVVSIAPAKMFAHIETVRIKPAQVISLSQGPDAWRRVAEVNGAQLPPKHPALFGLLQDYEFLGIVYSEGTGKRSAMLLDSYFSVQIVKALSAITHRSVEGAP